MSVGGKKRENQEFVKKVGLFTGRVIAINPSEEEYESVLGITLDENRALEYLGERDGNTTLRIDVWTEDKEGDKRKVSFFLEDKERSNKEETKKQYINGVGVCSWADDPNNLPDWFKSRQYRVAHTGEEELYEFLRTWLGKLDYRDAETVLEIDWKKLMKNNLSDIREQIDGEYCNDEGVGLMGVIITKEKDGEIKEYQGVYNKGCLPPYSLKYFRLIDYSKEEERAKLLSKKPKDLKIHEKFVLKVYSEFGGCRDYFELKDLHEYNPADNPVNSPETNIPDSDGPNY